MSEENVKKEAEHRSSGETNSAMDIIKKILTPGHAIGKFGLEILDAIGLKKPLESLVYQIEDPLLLSWFSKSYDWKIFNEEYIPPVGNAAVIACNHQSILDPLTSGLAIFHKSRRMAWQLTKSELGDDPLLGMYVSVNHVIFIHRGEQDEKAIEQCVKALTEEKGLVLVYPEGTYGPGHGEFLPFKSGVIRIAMLGNVPIIPMASYGVDEIMGAEASRKMKMPNKEGVIRIKFGKPIPVSELLDNKKNPDKDDMKAAAEKLQAIVHGLWEELAKDERNKPPKLNKSF